MYCSLQAGKILDILDSAIMVIVLAVKLNLTQTCTSSYLTAPGLQVITAWENDTAHRKEKKAAQ